MTEARLTEAMRAVLKRGYCVMYFDGSGSVRYSTWRALLDRGMLEHERSNLDAPWPWERYRATEAGRRALAEEK